MRPPFAYYGGKAGLARRIREGLAEQDIPITADTLGAFSAGGTVIAGLNPQGVGRHHGALVLAVACLAGQLLRGEV